MILFNDIVTRKSYGQFRFVSLDGLLLRQRRTSFYPQTYSLLHNNSSSGSRVSSVFPFKIVLIELEVKMQHFYSYTKVLTIVYKTTKTTKRIKCPIYIYIYIVYKAYINHVFQSVQVLRIYDLASKLTA